MMAFVTLTDQKESCRVRQFRQCQLLRSPKTVHLSQDKGMKNNSLGNNDDQDQLTDDLTMTA